MNTHNLTETGGFPFDQSTLAFYQDNIALVMATAALAGPRSIISGCLVAGANVSDGVVVINGELLPFAGGLLQDKVVIVEQINSLLYIDGVSRPVQKIRYATFGDDGVTNLPFSSFKRNNDIGVLARLDALEADNSKLKLMAAPFINGGGMVLWRRPFNEIPAGWQEVADWRARMPIGYDPTNPHFDEPGIDYGGSFAKTLTGDNIPQFTINLPATSNGVAGSGGIAFDKQNNASVPLTIGSASPTPIDLTNPYRVVVFIEPIPVS